MINEFSEDVVYSTLPRVKLIQRHLFNDNLVAAIVELKVLQSELEEIKSEIDEENDNRAMQFVFANCVELGIG